MSYSILSTKLFIPDIRDNYISRSTLVNKLMNGINMSYKLTLVSAPAGYGKTTLVLELLKSMEMAHAWISLDENDNDIVQFLSYLVAALKKAGAAIGSNTEEMAMDFNIASTYAPMTMIINDISILPKKFILILDDYHFIHSTLVNDAVKYLMEHQPPNLHLIIITREDPYLPLPRIRAQGRISEIRMEDLCFNREETADFFSKVMKLNIGDEAVDTISARTEGWIAGLQLAGLSLNGCEEKDIGEFIRVLHDTHQYIIDYLVEEVVNHQPEKIREFLYKTSVLGRMNGELCDTVLERSGCKQLLRELDKSNLFLIPMDSKREWYRYHHLFADSLRTQLSKDEEMLIHRKAALWLEGNGFLQEAVEHAFSSGDKPMALRLVENSMEQAFKNAQLMTFVKWLKLLPEELIKNSEILSVRKAWALLMMGKGSETHDYLNSLGESFFEKATPHNKGLFLSLKAVMAQYSGQKDAEQQAEEALRYLEPWDSLMRIAALNTLGRAQEDNGRTADAVKTLQTAYNESRKLGYAFVTTLTLMNLGTNLNGMGRRLEAFGLYKEYIDGMINEFGKPLPFIGIIYVGMAGLYYESNELEKAQIYMEKGSELCKSIFFNWIQTKGILESRIQFAFGKKEAAINTIKESIAAIHNNVEIQVLNTASLVEFLLRCGNLEEAKLYTEELKSYMSCEGNTASREAYLPYVRLMLYQARKEEALELLGNMELQIEKTQKGKELITFYILYARAHYLNRDYQKAQNYYDRAINLAEPQGYYRLFLDEEPIIKDIIYSGKIVEGNFISNIAEFLKTPPESAALQGKPLCKRTEPEKKLRGLEHTERLSNREKEILELLGKGMSNSEIAEKLYISINTTQWHISHIYSKLGVQNRMQAVLKAREMHIL